MGWWTIKQSDKELIQGDVPYDIMMEAFQRITQEYRQDWNRKPTLAEITQTIKTVLATGMDTYISDGEKIEIIDLIVKTKKRKKYQLFQVGNFFMIPLEDKIYAFGRILSDLRLDEMGMLVGIYDKISTSILPYRHLKGLQFMFPPFYCDDQGWKTWKWKIIGNDVINTDEFEYPKHKEGIEGRGWRIRDRNRIYEATLEEVEGLEYATLWSTIAVEKRIMKNLEIKNG